MQHQPAAERETYSSGKTMISKSTMAGGDSEVQLEIMKFQLCLYIQSNSSIHNSYRALIWLQEEGWEVADHPACSPGLNPIEGSGSEITY